MDLNSLRAGVAAALACTLASAAIAQGDADWVEIKGTEALRALYSNKTHKSRDWVSHWRDDGQGIMVATGAKSPIRHTWQIKGDDQVCTTSSVGTSCYRYQRSRRKANEVMATFVAQPVSFFFSMEDGVPKF